MAGYLSSQPNFNDLISLPREPRFFQIRSVQILIVAMNLNLHKYSYAFKWRLDDVSVCPLLYLRADARTPPTATPVKVILLYFVIHKEF